MLQPADLCRNKVQDELKEEDCHDTLDFVMTLIKENGSGTLSRQSLLCRNIKYIQ